MDKSDTRRFAGGRVHFMDAIGTREDAYSTSPVSMMDKFNVPVLIAHGKDDPRVPYQNATDLRSYLDKAGKPYEWLADPKELQGFASEDHNEEPWNRSCRSSASTSASATRLRHQTETAFCCTSRSPAQAGLRVSAFALAWSDGSHDIRTQSAR